MKTTLRRLRQIVREELRAPTADCRVCGGTGEVAGEFCATCSGEGREIDSNPPRQG